MNDKEMIWIDDTRKPPSEEYRWCTRYKQAIATIKYLSTCEDGIDHISFDHDLGGKRTGYDIARYIIEHQIPLGSFSCHSQNPVGRKNIRELLLHYGYKEKIL